VWEPFGGLCSASVAAVALGRRAFAAETDQGFADLAEQRLRGSAETLPGSAEIGVTFGTQAAAG
jgi:site-specific DNA-methyltransferase (adenine-specific)